MDISLPQNDPNPAQRAAALTAQRQQYQYSQTKLSGKVAMVDQVPQQDQSLTKFEWVRDTISLILRIQANQGLQDINEQGLTCSAVKRLLGSIWLFRLLQDPQQAGFLRRLLMQILSLLQRLSGLIGRQPRSENLEADARKGNTRLLEARVRGLVSEVQSHHPHPVTAESVKTFAQTSQALVSLSSPGASLLDYPTLFKDYKDLFQLIYLPCISDHFHQDRVFAAQRVAGPNPLVIEQVKTLPDNFPVTDAQYQAVMGEQDALAVAAQEGRLYLADYKVLEGVKTGNFPSAQKYLCAPLALFAVPAGTSPGRSLVPVAIQCGQQPGPDTPIFTPPPETPQSQKWSWLMAKTIVQIADGNYHELISHLGRTHLLIEAFVLATERQLAPNHPLGVLLRPHFEGTLFINDAAVKGLINPGGTVDAVLGGTLDESIRITAEGIQGYPFSFNDSMVPHTFVSRGVDNPEQLPDYPYRDDALLIWEAIHQWVSDYLTLYYPSDQAVLEDPELQHWLADLIDPNGGKLSGIGEPTPGQSALSIRTRAYLTDAVTLLLFTCSAQHAAVNFPQASFMTYGPNMPLAGYRPAPAVGASLQDYLDLLPSLDQTETQMNMTYLLGSVYYTRLGEYGDTYFTDPQVKAPLLQFQTRLKQIGIVIDTRNATRPTFYDFLHPAKIPQSVNI
jgi:arachidonate 15-lipoxygenase